MIRAKFVCVEKSAGEEGDVKLQAVTHGSPENEVFYKYTPYGEIKIGILNPNAFERFEVGKEYYVDFTEVSPATDEQAV